MFRRCVAIGVLLAGVAAWAVLADDKKMPPAVEPPPAPPAAKPRPVLITAELSRTHAQPGDVVRLTELVPDQSNIRVDSVAHDVYTIGQYNFTTNTLVNRGPEQRMLHGGGVAFDESRISGTVTVAGDKAMLFDVTNPRQEGMEFSFKARQIGIYLIKARWRLFHSDEVIESNPVVLTVSPPLDKRGKPIIKERWIDPITWELRPR